MLPILKETFQRLLEKVSITHYRYLYYQLELNNRLTGIVGPRGVGKTTLMLQYIKNHFPNQANVFYFSADHIFFNQTTLFEFVNDLYRYDGIRIFFVDEIHKYGNWNQELKNIYDAFPDIKVIFSGSSSIDLVKGAYDLSRRAKLYHLHGMSFREYLNFNLETTLQPISLAEIFQNNHKTFKMIAEIPKLLGYFKEFLQTGYYPFLMEDNYSYYEKISNIIEKAIYEDIANFYNLKTPNLHYFKKILNYIATIPPGELNTHNFARNLNIDYKTAFHYLTILDEIELIRMIYAKGSGNVTLRKPEKIFLENTTLFYALNSLLSAEINSGSVRELFFLQSLQNANQKVFYSKQGDYLINNNIMIEIGGKNKTRKQLKSSENAYLVKDDILTGFNQELPLYYFGFLY